MYGTATYSPDVYESRVFSRFVAAPHPFGLNFVGNTPSTIGVSPGEHTVGVKKTGYKTWERKITVSSGKVNISAELEPESK
jgi:PEGA domain